VAESDDAFVTTLLHPDEYPKHLNQVAGLTTRDIKFLKRKFVSKTGWELVTYPVTECSGITYKDERPIASLVFGFFLLLIVAIIGYGLVTYWDSLTPRTKIPIGGLGFAILYGFRATFLSRRHRLIFSMKDGSRLIWKTLAGDYKYQQPRAQKVIEFARSRGLLQESNLQFRPA
jgi:hypothetical protein